MRDVEPIERDGFRLMRVERRQIGGHAMSDDTANARITAGSTRSCGPCRADPVDGISNTIENGD